MQAAGGDDRNGHEACEDVETSDSASAGASMATNKRTAVQQRGEEEKNDEEAPPPADPYAFLAGNIAQSLRARLRSPPVVPQLESTKSGAQSCIEDADLPGAVASLPATANMRTLCVALDC